MRKTVLGLIAFSALLVGCAAGNSPDAEGENSADGAVGVQEGAMLQEEEEEEIEEGYFCEAPEHIHQRGMLTAEYEDGELVGWTCTLSSHHICTAPADGIWTECTFEPPGWPEPVTEEFLRNPPLEESDEDEEYEEYDEYDEEAVME